MTTQTTEARIEARRLHLTKQRAERKDELDLPRTLTMRQVREYASETALLDQNIADFESKAAAYAALPTLDADTKWRDHLVAWRATLNAELMAIRTPIRDDATRDRARSLGFQIELIDEGFGIAKLPVVDLSSTRLGELLKASGYETQGEGLRGPRGWRGGIKEVEARIAALAEQRAADERALDAALMDDAERAKADAASQAHRDALNRLHLRINSDGSGYVAHDEYGDVRDLAMLTPAEREVFDRADGAYRQARLDRAMGREPVTS